MAERAGGVGGAADGGRGEAGARRLELARPRGRGARSAGVRFRNEIVSGPGGKQVLALDPSGNIVELFEPSGS